MSDNFPEWYKVLNFFYENDAYENGLTIPFLIGVSTIRTPKEPIITIDQLFKGAQNPNLPHKIELRCCEFEEEFVLRIYDKENLVALDELDRQYDNLIITEESLAYLNLEEVIQEMYHLYQEPINKKLYGRFMLNWCEYSESDIDLIIESK